MIFSHKNKAKNKFSMANQNHLKKGLNSKFIRFFLFSCGCSGEEGPKKVGNFLRNLRAEEVIKSKFGRAARDLMNAGPDRAKV